ncbi:MAG: hypothetical protein KDB27_12045 [Planctomycetales bacterium]|nr:hypothetical protein [Planctomycetales bacterium]
MSDSNIAAPASRDPFDPKSLRLSQSQTAGIGVKRVISHLKCDKPNGQEYIRSHPDESYRIETAILRDKTERQDYLVAPALWADLAGEITPVRIVAAITRHNVPFLWPATLPAPDGRSNRWHESMLEAQQRAVKSWTRVQADMASGEYLIFEATGNLPDPEWPELSFREMLELTFKTRLIDSMDHAFLRNLRGEV